MPEHEIDRRGVVGDVQPVPPLEAVAVERQRPVVERVRDEQRDELLGVVERAVRVRAAGDHRVDAVRDVVAPREQLTGRLRGGVRRARVERVVLAGVPLGDRAVHLVRRDLDEADLPVLAVLRPDGLEQGVDADDVRDEEGLRLEDRAVHVRLGGEVEHRVGLADELADRGGVGDVPADEAQPGRLLGVVEHRPEVRLVAGVRELVEDRDPRPVAARQDVPDVRRADEARPAGDQQVRHTIGRSRGATSLPLAWSSAASSAARSRLATVPASVQWPS